MIGIKVSTLLLLLWWRRRCASVIPVLWSMRNSVVLRQWSTVRSFKPPAGNRPTPNVPFNQVCAPNHMLLKWIKEKMKYACICVYIYIHTRMLKSPSVYLLHCYSSANVRRRKKKRRGKTKRERGKKVCRWGKRETTRQRKIYTEESNSLRKPTPTQRKKCTVVYR